MNGSVVMLWHINKGYIRMEPDLFDPPYKQNVHKAVSSSIQGLAIDY